MGKDYEDEGYQVCLCGQKVVVPHRECLAMAITKEERLKHTLGSESVENKRVNQEVSRV